MTITRTSFGLVTQLLDLAPLSVEETAPAASSLAWEPVVEQLTGVGVGAVAEEVTLGEDDTVARFLELQTAAHQHGLETFLRLRELSDEALQVLRDQAMEAAAKRAPGEVGPPSLRVMVDLGQPDAEDIARWLPRHTAEMAERHQAMPDDGPAGGWGQALAFSLFASEADAALRRLDDVGEMLIEAANRPGVELPVWLAAFAIDDEGPGDGAAGVIQVAAHALSLGIERVFLAAGPEAGWWPADLRSPPPPLQAFRTLIHQLDGATSVTRLTAGQYLIERMDQSARYLLWRTEGSLRFPPDLQGTIQVTNATGETSRVEATQLHLTDEPVFVETVG